MTAFAPGHRAARSLLLAAAAFGLAGFGPTQPQSVTGPCQVRQFFIVALGTSHTTMTTSPAGTCTFSLINPDLQLFQTAALITTRPLHGQADAGLLEGGRSAELSYQPAPGFVGHDRFAVTIEPADKVVIVSVTVSGAAVINRALPGPGGPGLVDGGRTGAAGSITTRY